MRNGLVTMGKQPKARNREVEMCGKVVCTMSEWLFASVVEGWYKMSAE